MTIEEVIAGVPDWDGRDVTVEPIEGGITNTNYRLTVEGERFCVRIPGRDSSLLAIDRTVEHANTLAAAASGVGAGVAYAAGDTPVMVLEWIDGVVRDEAGLAELDDTPRRIAEATRRLHAGPAFVGEFDMFRIQEGYLRICRERGFRIPDGYDSYLPLVGRIEAAMAAQGHDPAPCNNDLMAGNYIDDGERFRIIDYEYSGTNDPCFELGNTFALLGLSPDQLEEMIACYFGAPLRSRVARANLWAAMAGYGWTLWACIQAAVSEIDFDFWGWGVGEKYAQAVAAFDGPEIGGWLDAVTHSD